jgi:hypothetical protein
MCLYVQQVCENNNVLKSMKNNSMETDWIFIFPYYSQFDANQSQVTFAAARNHAENEIRALLECLST